MIDKIIHLMIGVVVAIPVKKTVLPATLIGIMIEVLQALTGLGVFDPWDAAACSVGGLLIWLLTR